MVDICNYRLHQIMIKKFFKERISSMNSTVKVINVVCDNVRRTLSRYLHMNSHGHGRLSRIGMNLTEFSKNVKTTLLDMHQLLDQIMREEGNGTFPGNNFKIQIMFYSVTGACN